MSTYQAIRNRLKSVSNVLHITQAMEVVAGVRFRKLMGRVEHFRFYANKLSELVSRLILTETTQQHPLSQNRAVNRIGVIIIAADKGLCGAYNQNIFNAAKRFLKTLETDKVDLILFGNKAIEHFKSCKWTIRETIPDFAKQLTEQAIQEWSQSYIQAFETAEFDELWIVFTHYKNMLSKETRVEKLLPLENKEPKSDLAPVDFIFEPSSEEIYQNVIPTYFSVKLQSLLLESYTSELSDRMVAMKGATKNAEEMIESLTLIKNKTRQLSITNEILEITAGAENLK